MQKQIGKIGAIRRRSEAKPALLRGHIYQLVLRGNMQPKLADSLPVVLSASVLADSMRTSVESSGCRKIPYRSAQKEDTMRVLSSPIEYIKLRSAHKKQKRTALHMLALSGVVRPSHVELRYATPIDRLPPSVRSQLRSGIRRPTLSLYHHGTTTPHSI